MKRILVLLLALCTLLAFTACGDASEEETKPVISDETTAATESAPETTVPEETTTLEETTTVPDTTTEAATTTTAPSDPTSMSKEQLIVFYNNAVNAVRAARPAYTRVEVLKINSVKTSLAGGMLDGLLNPIVKNLMPGEPKPTSKKKGDSNADHFFIEQQTSAVKASDAASISAKKDGANFVITLSLGSETNPAKMGASKYSRVFQIQTREELLESLAKDGLTADVNNTSLLYRDGKVVVTINDKGQIIEAHAEFFVDANAKQAKLSMFTFDLTAYQQSNWDYTGFTY